jgi:hypothetical protein
MNMDVIRQSWNWDDIIAIVDTKLYQYDFESESNVSVRRRVGKHWVDFDPNHPSNVNIDCPSKNEIKLSTLVEVFDLSDNDEVKTIRIFVTLNDKGQPVRFETEK